MSVLLPIAGGLLLLPGIVWVSLRLLRWWDGPLHLPDPVAALEREVFAPIADAVTEGERTALRLWRP